MGPIKREAELRAKVNTGKRIASGLQINLEQLI